MPAALSNATNNEFNIRAVQWLAPSPTTTRAVAHNAENLRQIGQAIRMTATQPEATTRP
jgi:hypothetical protein